MTKQNSETKTTEHGPNGKGKTPPVDRAAIDRDLAAEREQATRQDAPADDGQATTDARLNQARRTDTGNAECMAQLFGARYRFVGELGSWHTWTGAYWRAGRADIEVLQAARDTARARQAAAWSLTDNDQRTKLITWGLHSENANRIAATEKQARITDPFTSWIGQYDRHEELIATTTQTVNLRSGIAHDPRPDDYLTKIAGCAYDPAATCPRWLQFLREVFSDDQELIAYIQRAVGYSLTGNTREQVFWLCYGQGANGKSVFLEVLARLAGDYHYSTSFSIFDAEARDREASITLVALRGKRLLSIIETDEDRRLAEARIKALTGQDAIECRPMYGTPIVYTPQFKPWVAMNHKPVITGRDHALWRRLKLIPFLQTFEGAQADKHLRESLRDELSGILNWAIQGARDWYAHGLTDPAAIRNATAEYRQQSDLVGQWLEERTVNDADAEMHFGAAYKDFSNWANDRGFKRHPDAHIWARRLAEKGIETKRRGGQVRIPGYSLRGIEQP